MKLLFIIVYKMDIVISKSENKNKKMKVVIDGKKQFILVRHLMRILQLIMTLKDVITIFRDTQRTKTGEQVVLILRGFGLKMYYGIRKP